VYIASLLSIDHCAQMNSVIYTSAITATRQMQAASWGEPECNVICVYTGYDWMQRMIYKVFQLIIINFYVAICVYW